MKKREETNNLSPALRRFSTDMDQRRGSPAGPPCHRLLWTRNLGIDPRSRASSTMDLGDSGRIEALAGLEREEGALSWGRSGS